MRWRLVLVLLFPALVASGASGGAASATRDAQLLFTTDSAADGSRELHLTSLDGTPATRLTIHEPRGHMPSYLRNGNSILFSTFGGDSGDALWLATTDGRARRRIATPRAGADIEVAAPSPDGRTIAVIDDNQGFWLVDAATGRRRRVPGATYAGDIAWAPDGSRLAASYESTEQAGVLVFRRDGSASGRIILPRTRAEADFEFNPIGLSWAPDGSAVAYAWGLETSEIRVAAVGGRRVWKLGSGYGPAWSPDARRVAFIKGRSIFVAGRDGVGRRLLARAPAQPSDLTWSADGKTIGFLAADPPLHGVDVRTGRIRVLTSPLRLGKRVRDPQWSPRGDAAASGAGAAFLASVGTKWRRILAGATDGSPSWSRDGSSVAFRRVQGKRSSIMLLRLGEEARVLAAGRAPQLAPDGTRVAFYRDSGLFVWSGNGRVQRVAPSGDGAAWSPDGTRLAWTDGNALFVAPIGGAARLRARNKRCDYAGRVDAGFPAWSPDGQTIVFGVIGRDSGCSDLAIVDAASGQERSLGEATSARWSPDGTELAVHNGYEIRVLGVRSGSVLARWPGDEPSWSPDGSLVAYSRRVGAPYATHVYVRQRDGSGARRVTSGVRVNAEPLFRPLPG